MSFLYRIFNNFYKNSPALERVKYGVLNIGKPSAPDYKMDAEYLQDLQWEILVVCKLAVVMATPSFRQVTKYSYHNASCNS